MKFLGITGLITLLATLLLVVDPFEAQAMGRKKAQYLMGAMGDSISAGTLADTSTPLTDEDRQMPAEIPELNPEKTPTQIIYTNKSTYSWTSGRMIGSHYIRLKSHLAQIGDKSGLNIQNVAVPGNTTNSMPRQADELIAAFEKGGYKTLKYVTFMIGANDACTLNSVEKMRANLRTTFRKLAQVQQDEQIRILVSGMPRIPDLGREEIRNHRTLGPLSCDYVRSELIDECDPLLQWSTPAEYREKVLAVEERNALLEEMAREANSLYPNLDVHFTNAFYAERLTLEDLALDCFHPNQSGQQRISNTLWDAQPWFK